MKKSSYQFSFTTCILLAIVLGFAALFLSGIIYNTISIKPYFPFVGELLLILFTWLFYRLDGQDLSALGLQPTLKNTGYLFFGLVIGVVALLLATWLRTQYTGEVWHLSTALDAEALAKSLYYILPTVMMQELVFRGYLFTKTINRFGVVWANVLFAFAFMLAHVLDGDVLHNPARIVMLVISIPVGHLWFATALLRSKTILFPIGLHWGNNWAVTHLAGAADNPLNIFYLTHQKVYTTWPSFLFMLLLFNGFFLLVIWATAKGRLPFAAKPIA